jgi:hypothetical protein
MKKAYIFFLFSAVSIIISCQKDIPLLGEDENGNTVVAPKTEVYIRSITLSSFPENNPSTLLPWDDGSVQPFDLQDSIGPDIYYYIYYYNPDNELPPIFYKQLSHFSDVLPLNPDSPLVYTLTEPFQIIPEYVDTTFYLTMFDLDFGEPNDSTFIDSIRINIGEDTAQTHTYSTSISTIGLNGSKVILGLEWK